VFYFDLKYGTTKGTVTAGNTLVRDFNNTYSSEVVDAEIMGVGDATAVTFSSSLDFLPIKTGTVKVQLSDGSVISAFDDGAGNITGTGITAGTVNYTTGAISVTFAAAPAAAVNVNVGYLYNMEANTNIPQINIDIALVEVRAKTRKLKALWSSESADDLKAYQ
jgi:hypothetical protein